MDRIGSDIYRFSAGLAPYMDRFDYQMMDVHPESPTSSQLKKFEELGQFAHIIDFQHPETALMLMKKYPWLKNKKKTLVNYHSTHFNKHDYQQFEKVVTVNKTMHKAMPGSLYIPLTVNTHFWTFNPRWDKTNQVIMVVDQITKEKGILEIALACRKLKLNLYLIGSISDTSYFDKIMKTGAVTYHQKLSDEQRRDLYYQSTLYICNSVDPNESGPVSMLEAMLCGVPVLTRSIGHVPELYRKENIRILNTDIKDVRSLRKTLQDLLSNKETLQKMREKAWQVASKYSDERRAYQYQRLYRSLMEGSPVSVIVAIYEYPQTIQMCLQAIANQDYSNLEIIVCDDNPIEDHQSLIREFARTVPLPVVYRNTSRKENDYGLARARNIGIIEASGDILVFCDQRISMESHAVSEFVKHITPKKWLYGTKGVIKGFVENFSCVYRQDLIRAGMFFERMDLYGGMTQEIYRRTKSQGFTHEFIPTATAKPNIDSFSLSRRRADIISMRNRLFRMNY